MIKKDLQMQVMQMLFTQVLQLEHMPRRWRDDHLDDDDIYCIRRECGRGTIDKGAAEHFDWLDDRYDYCERMYDCYTCVYECPKYDELTKSVNQVVDKFKKLYPTSKVSVDIDGYKDVFYLVVNFELSDEDFNATVAKIKKPKTTKKTDGGIQMSERGKEIIEWLQGQPVQSYTAREISEGLFCSPRSIPGAMNKLVKDGYVQAEKVGSAPNQYKLTQSGNDLNTSEL